MATLFRYLKVIRDVLSEEQQKEIQSLKRELEEAIVLMERYFPVSIQVRCFTVFCFLFFFVVNKALATMS